MQDYRCCFLLIDLACASLFWLCVPHTQSFKSTVLFRPHLFFLTKYTAYHNFKYYNNFAIGVLIVKQKKKFFFYISNIMRAKHKSWHPT